MSTETKEGQVPSTEGQAPTVKDQETKPPVVETEDPAVLKAELDRARKEAAKFRVQAREAAEKEKKAAESALADQGKHKELAESRAKELEALKSELEPLRAFKSEIERAKQEQEAKRAAQVAVEFAKLPESIRTSIPADADPTLKQHLINAFTAGSGGKAPTTTSVTPRTADAGGSGDGDELSDAELARAYLPSTSAEDKARLQKRIAEQRARG